jgi:hypothetical protein
LRSRASMARWRMMPFRPCRSYGFSHSPTENRASG